MKAIIFFLLSILMPFALFSQYSTGPIDLKVSGYTSVHDGYTYLNQEGDTLLDAFKAGKGTYTKYEFSYLFKENHKGNKMGLTFSHLRGQEGFILNLCGDAVSYHSRYGDYAKTKLGLAFANSEALPNGDLYSNIYLVYEKNKYNYDYSESLNNYLRFSDTTSRVGVSLNIGSTFGRFMPYSKWFKKTEISAFGELYSKVDFDHSRIAYGGDVNVNIFSILGEKDFYLSPNIGVSIIEQPMYSLGVSPIISVGLNVSSTWSKKDLLKVHYQYRVYRQSSVPYNGIDGVYFSVNLGAFLWR